MLSSPDQAVEFVVDGLTLENGNASGYGGGIFVKSPGTITLTNNTITGNAVSYGMGGGVYTEGTTITLTNNTITGNTVSQGGGGGVYTRGTTITLINNTINENTAIGFGGGGVYTEGTTITLINNTITENTATGFRGGGGVSISAATITLTNNTITGNAVSYGMGGGVGIWGTTIILTNNTITGNTASDGGGGAYVSLSDNLGRAKLYNNIVFNNKASTDGNDLNIKNDGNQDFLPSAVDLYNNDFDKSAAGIYIQLPFPIDPSNLDNADPLFVGGGNYHLTADSPCINAGDNDAPDLPETDKDGNPRIMGGTVDMGAYEYVSSSLPSVSTGTASLVASTSAILNGNVNPNGASTTVVFEYGTTLSYGSTVTATQSPLTGTSSQAVSMQITGLSPSTTYHFRVKATNSAGTTYGSDISFTTSSAVSDELVAYYPFNGNANDESGNGSDGIVNGAYINI